MVCVRVSCDVQTLKPAIHTQISTCFSIFSLSTVTLIAFLDHYQGHPHKCCLKNIYLALTLVFKSSNQKRSDESDLFRVEFVLCASSANTTVAEGF